MPSAASPLRILVVDDDRDLMESLVAVVGMLGHQGHGVTSGLAALAHLADAPCDLVFMDVTMPGLDGFETARRLRREPWGAHTVLVAMTGWELSTQRVPALEAGFDWVYEKPIDVGVIRTVLEQFRSV
ncbi:MAG: response regulator [Gemmatimonadaceae bacterium]|nr:response regulator [Gemmatimonadaceae bacterium]